MTPSLQRGEVGGLGKEYMGIRSLSSLFSFQTFDWGFEAGVCVFFSGCWVFVFQFMFCFVFFCFQGFFVFVN